MPRARTDARSSLVRLLPVVRRGRFTNYQATLTARTCTVQTNDHPQWNNPGSLENLGRVVDSVCLSLVDGRLQCQVIRRSVYDLGPVESR